MNTLALVLGYIAIGVVSLVVVGSLLTWLWMYLSRSIYHAYIQAQAFKAYPNGTDWVDGYKEKRFKFFRCMWNNLCNPRQTIRGTSSCAYYVVGHKGLMPHGFVRGEFTGPIGNATEENENF